MKSEFLRRFEPLQFRAGSELVVDCCREAATAILSKYFQSQGEKVNGRDLAELANAAEKLGREIVANSAKTLARLHLRRKHSEQEKRQLRAISEQDAEYAVQSVGMILCEIDWGYWSI